MFVCLLLDEIKRNIGLHMVRLSADAFSLLALLFRNQAINIYIIYNIYVYIYFFNFFFYSYLDFFPIFF